MRIAHIINSNKYSGLENVVCTIMQEADKNIEMVYVTKDGPIIEILKEKKLNFYIIESMSTKEIKKFIKKWHPDILHAHDYTASLVCSLVKKNIPLIEHLHHNAPWIKQINIKSLLFLYSGKRADKILTVSEAIEKEFIFKKIVKKKIEIIGNPVSRKKIIEQVSQKDYEKKYDICCVGRLTEAKNPKRFLKIIKKVKESLPNIKVIWIGDGELYDEVIKYQKELKLDENIEFVGFKKNPYPDMASSKVFLLTSSWEGYGLVAFEALTLGLPCIVSNVGGLPSIVDNKCGKLCNTDDDFTNKTVELLTNQEVLQKYAKNALKKAEELENITEYIKNIKNLYKELYR